MTDLKTKTINLIKQMPENEMPRVFREVQNLYESCRPLTPAEKALEAQRRKEAWEYLQKIREKYRGKVPADFDYKKELEDALVERYEEKCRAADEEYKARQQGGAI